ncbi:hypothetical protein FRB90_006511 [Tulasnella sp. 427]|nr:hypothetical protein FRB90_006511 [Tulasnella sp. 427]
MHPVFEVQEILCLIFNTTPIPLSRILDATGSARKEIFIMLGEQPLFAIDVGEIKEVDWRKFSALSNKISRILLESHLEEPSMQSINVAKETFGGEIFSRLRTVKTQTIDHQQKAISLLAVPSLLQRQTLAT